MIQNFFGFVVFFFLSIEKNIFLFLLHFDFSFSPLTHSHVCYLILWRTEKEEKVRALKTCCCREFIKNLEWISAFPFDLGINDAGGKSAIPNISVFLICTSLCFLKRTQESLWKFQPKLHQAQCLVSVHQLLAREQRGEKYWVTLICVSCGVSSFIFQICGSYTFYLYFFVLWHHLASFCFPLLGLPFLERFVRFPWGWVADWKYRQRW